MCCVPGKTLLGSVRGPRISPFGTPSCGKESGPSRYCEFGFGPVGMGGGACANARNADAAAKGSRDAVLFFMDSVIIYDSRPGNPVRRDTVQRDTTHSSLAPWVGQALPPAPPFSRQELEPVQVAHAAGAAAVSDHDVEGPHSRGYGDGCGHRGPRLPAARNRNERLRDDGSGRTVQMEHEGAARAC